MGRETSKPKINSLIRRFAKPFRHSNDNATELKPSPGQPLEELVYGPKAGPVEDAPQSTTMQSPPLAADHPSLSVGIIETSPSWPGTVNESSAGSPPDTSIADTPVSSHAAPASPRSSALNNDSVTIDETKRSKSVSELTDAIVQFKTTYTTFVQKNSQFIQFDEYLDEEVFSTAQAECDIRQGAKKFSDSIWATLETIQKKRKLAEGNWTTKFGNVLIKLYPVTRLSLSLVGAIGDAACFSPLKGTAAGLAIILQILDAKASQSDAFLSGLRRIEFQAAIIADNPSYDLNSDSTKHLVEDKARDLMTASVNFFNAALIYFSKSFAGNLAKSITAGTTGFEEAQKKLDIAIREHDQAVLHLAARTIASLTFKQQSDQRERQDEKFLKWLSPSYWLVEDQLHSFRQQRGEDTLKWVPDFEEFQRWRLADYSSNDRILWIRGTLGIGKSTLAGYFIDLLKCHHPNSIVAYFFCRSNQAGLTKARDIIRTLSYQCIGRDPNTRSILEDLRTQGFCIDDNVSVSFLFEKLLLEPVCCTTKEIFLIVDGLDEGDLTTVDETDRSERPEMNILLKCLAKLPSTRLLFLSRPTANIASVIHTTIRSIGMAENGQDITAYVEKTLAESDKLKTFFKNENVDPVDYFRDKANGIFLWVVLVLQQLAGSKSRLIFQKRLKGFSAASGSMDKLYQNILSKVGEEDLPWVREITRWLVVAQRQLTELELQEAVEWRLGDALADFRSFSEVECGSILHMLPKDDDSNRPVQLVHETFRSFLLNPDKCPKEFLIHETLAHGDMVLNCLTDLAEFGEDSFTFKTYGLDEWVKHLSKSTMTEKSQQLLALLLGFFNSDGMELWIRRSLLSRGPQITRALQINCEMHDLPVLADWFKDCQSYLEKNGTTGGEGGVETMRWYQTINNPLAFLGECLGKGAVRLWLKEELGCHDSRRCFLLALKYYLKRESQSESVLKELSTLVTTEFELMAEWTGDKGKRPTHQNLGMAYWCLHSWDKCIRSLEDGIMDSNSDPEIDVLNYLGMAYMAKGDHARAIKTFWKATKIAPPYISGIFQNPHFWFRPGLLQAYEARGNYEEAIDEFKRAIDLYSETLGPKICLGHMYNALEDYDAAIEWFKKTKSRDLWSFHGLYTAYRMKRDYRKAINDYQSFKTRNPFYEIQIVSDCFCDLGDIKGEIEWLNSNSPPAFVKGRYLRQMELYIAMQDWDSFIREFENVVNGPHPYYNQSMRSSWVIKSYNAKNDLDGAAKMFKKLERQAPGVALLGFLEICKLREDYDRIIKTFGEMVEFLNDKNYNRYHDELVNCVFEANRMKGNYDGALQFGESEICNNPGILIQRSVLQLCEAMGDYDRAISIFDRAINSNPLCPSLLRSLAAAYKANRNYKAAIDTLQRGVHVISLDYSFHLLLGNIHSLNAEFHDSILAYNAAIDSASSHSILFAYIDNDYCYNDTGQISISIDDSLPSHFLWYSLGNARSAVSDDDGTAKVYDAAINGYHIALRKNTRNKLLWRYSEPNVEFANFDVFVRRESLPKRILWWALGKAYECKGDFRQALRAYQMVLQLEQDNAWLQNVTMKLGKEVPGHHPVESKEDTEFWQQVEGVQQSVEHSESPIGVFVVPPCGPVPDFES